MQVNIKFKGSVILSSKGNRTKCVQFARVLIGCCTHHFTAHILSRPPKLITLFSSLSSGSIFSQYITLALVSLCAHIVCFRFRVLTPYIPILIPSVVAIARFACQHPSGVQHRLGADRQKPMITTLMTLADPGCHRFFRIPMNMKAEELADDRSMNTGVVVS